MRTDLQATNGRVSGLVDVLDRVLDKGLVVAGDIKISLAEVELLTIRVRLIVCSIDKAEQIGLDWWRYDTHLAPARDRLAVENASLKKQIRSLERRVAALAGATARAGPADRVRGRRPFPGRSNDAR
jgi:gas vesicle protein GvpA/GvpJ/GvpM family